MTLWLIFALMTAAAIFAVLWPLGRKPRLDRSGSDLLVYRDQLEEVGRDRAAGLIGEAEAEAARIEVSRRLLAAADTQPAAPLPPSALRPMRRRRAAAVAAFIILPFLPLGFYLMLGSPNIPEQPASARATAPQGNPSIATLVSQVEAHLASNPDDGAGWEVIGPVYMRLGRFDDAVVAGRKSIALNGDTPAREADLGEALVAAANGVVTAEANEAFKRAAAGDQNDAKANYFLGLADEQDGNREGAAAKWRAMLEEAPSGAPWVGFVRTALARVTGEPVAANGPGASQAGPGVGGAGPGTNGPGTGTNEPGPGARDIAAAAGMNDKQRVEMIRNMVQRLADRLHSDGSDVDGWLRLVRAYAVLGDHDKAKDAASDARRALASRPEEVKRIDDLAKNLGIEG